MSKSRDASQEKARKARPMGHEGAFMPLPTFIEVDSASKFSVESDVEVAEVESLKIWADDRSYDRRN